MSGLSHAEFEVFYEALARALDDAGPRNEALFLTRLALLLAQRGGNGEAANAALKDALEGLDISPLRGDAAS